MMDGNEGLEQKAGAHSRRVASGRTISPEFLMVSRNEKQGL